MNELLEKTRQINKLLQRSESVEYDSVAKVLSDVIDANALAQSFGRNATQPQNTQRLLRL